MLELRMDAEVVALANNVGRRVSMADGGPSPYDDMTTEYSWIFDLQATALRHLGRYDEALDQLHRAVNWGTKDKASHAINLASFLCELDRPEEAIAALPAGDTVNAYGKMQIESVRLAAAVQLGRDAEVSAALGYLREHAKDAPATYQHALLKAGDNEGAEHWLLARLDDEYMRSEALLELQGFSEPRYPPGSAEWHARSAELNSRPSVRAAVLKIGEIGRYAWRYDTFE
jgi:tetratricopeptide (TPR) repeat protein